MDESAPAQPYKARATAAGAPVILAPFPSRKRPLNLQSTTPRNPSHCNTPLHSPLQITHTHPARFSRSDSIQQPHPKKPPKGRVYVHRELKDGWYVCRDALLAPPRQESGGWLLARSLATQRLATIACNTPRRSCKCLERMRGICLMRDVAFFDKLLAAWPRAWCCRVRTFS